MKRKTSALLLALAFLLLSSCTPSGAENDDTTQQPEPPDALETETGDLSEPPSNAIDTANTIRFDSKLGCSLTYDSTLFTVEEEEFDCSFKTEADKDIWALGTLSAHSIWTQNSFYLHVTVNPLDASSVEEAVDYLCQEMNLDSTHEVGVRDEVTREDVTFGSGHCPAVRLTYNEVYAVGEVYVTEQNGTVFEVTVSSYYRPPEKELALAYAILDSITF